MVIFSYKSIQHYNKGKLNTLFLKQLNTRHLPPGVKFSFAKNDCINNVLSQKQLGKMVHAAVQVNIP